MKKYCNSFLPDLSCEPRPVPAPKPTCTTCAQPVMRCSETCKPTKITLRTQYLAPSLGGEDGAYAPTPGAYYDTVVIYGATGTIYIYDSNGVYTKIFDGEGATDLANIQESLAKIEENLNELFDPEVPVKVVENYAALEVIDPATLPDGGLVEVLKDETNYGLDMLYYYDAGTGTWQVKEKASPYYTKEIIQGIQANLQTNINLEVMAREADRDNLQTNINKEVEAREAADQTLETRIDEIVNSPDVRYIVDTYADLEAIDKSTIGDKDYARVLQDENYEDASTYYQFDKAEDKWDYVGQTGPYYTKGQIDAMIGEAVTRMETI